MPGMYKYSMEIESNVKKLLLDTKELQDRMDTLEGKEYKINLNIDEKKLGNVISNLEKMLDSLGKGTGDFKQFENLSKELSSIVSEVQSLSKAFGKVDDSGTKTLLSSIQNIDKSLSELSQNILNVNKNMNNMGGNTSGAVKQVENIGNAYQDAAKEAEKLADAQSKIRQKTNISSGDFKEQSTEIDLYHNLEKRKVTYDEIIDRIQTIVSLKEKEKSLSKTSDDTKLYQNLYDENDINWAGDTEGTINRISDRLKEIYIKYNGKISLINENDIQEAAYLLDILKGAGESPNLNKSQEKFYQNKKFSNDSLFDNIHVDSQKTGEIDKINTELSETYRWFNQLEGVSLNENIANEIKSLISDMQIGGKTANEYANDLLKIFNIEVGSNSAIEQQNKLQSELKETESQAEKTAMAVKEISSTTSQDQKKDAFHSDIDTSSSVKSLENLEEEIKKIFTDANELQNILDSLHNGKYFHLSWTTDGIDETGADERVRQLSKLLKEYGYTINNFKSDSDAFDTSGVINAIKEENNVLEQNTQKVKENTQAKEQNANVNLNKYDKRLDSYNGKVDKYQATIDRFNDGGWTSSTYLENVQAVKNAVHEYETLLNELKGKDASLVTSDDINRLDNYEKKIKDTIATVTNMSASEKGYSQLAGQKEIDKINKILRESSAMSSEAKAKIKAYKQELISGNPSASLEKIHGEIMKIVNAEELAGRAGKSFFDTLKNSGFHQIAAQMAGMFGLYDIINIGKQAIGVVTELDSAFTEMRKVSDETTQSLKNYQKTTFDTANDVGTTAMQIQNSTADWQRLGYSLDEASELAKNSNIYKNVGDMNIDEATEHMISSVQAWKSEFNDAVTASEEIMNRYNKIGNEFAISSADIGEAMETSAAALKAGGNDLNESIGLITAGNLIQQDASTTASAMKILSLRIRGAKADLDAMGESTDDLSDSTSKMREELKALTGVDIMKDENTFKSTAEIIQEMGKNWDKLTDVSKAAALEKLAGKNRASTVSGLIENYETIGKVIEAAENSENSALEENEKYLESIEGRTQKLTNQLQELASVSIKDDWIKGIISGLTNLLDLVTKLVDKIGIVPTILSGVGIFKGIKTFSKNLA